MIHTCSLSQLQLTSNLHFYVVPTQSSIVLTSSGSNSGIQITGSDVTLTCAVELNSAIMPSEIFLLMVDTQLSRDGTPLALTGPTVSGTAFTYTRRFESLEESDSGNYTCTATIQPQPTATYLTGNETLQSNAVNIRAAWYDNNNYYAIILLL